MTNNLRIGGGLNLGTRLNTTEATQFQLNQPQILGENSIVRTFLRFS